MQPNLEQAQIGRVYRITHFPDVFRLEIKSQDRWKPQYAFTLEPRQLSDFVAMCHYQQTSPESHFTQNRICSLATATGRITLSNEKLIGTRDGIREERILSGEEEWRRELKELFGIALQSRDTK